MARRNDHSKEELKELIFSSAKKIVAQKGYKELTARKLAAKVGYTPGTIYLFYKNIDDLVLHLNFESLGRLQSKIAQAVSTSKSSEKQIKLIASEYIKFSFDEHNFWELLFDYHYKDPQAIPKWYQEKVAELFALLETPIKDFVRSSKEAENLARVLWASLHGIVILSLRAKLTTSNVKSTDELLQALLKNFVKGLKA